LGTPLASEVELRSEKATALRRVGFKLEKLIAQIRALDEELATLTGEQRQLRLEERKKLWTEAETQRWYLIVQREAMGMTQHHDVDTLYPLPKP